MPATFTKAWVTGAWSVPTDCLRCQKKNLRCERKLSQTIQSVSQLVCKKCASAKEKCQIRHPCLRCLNSHTPCSLLLGPDDDVADADSCDSCPDPESCISIKAGGLAGLSTSFYSLLEAPGWKNTLATPEIRMTVLERWMHHPDNRESGSNLWHVLMDIFETTRYPAIGRLLMRGHVDRAPVPAMCIAMNNWIAATAGEAGRFRSLGYAARCRPLYHHVLYYSADSAWQDLQRTAWSQLRLMRRLYACSGGWGWGWENDENVLRIRFVPEGSVWQASACLHWRDPKVRGPDRSQLTTPELSAMEKGNEDVLVFFRNGKLYVAEQGSACFKRCQKSAEKQPDDYLWLCLDSCATVEADPTKGISLEQAFKNLLDRYFEAAWDKKALVRWGSEYDKAIDLPPSKTGAPGKTNRRTSGRPKKKAVEAGDAPQAQGHRDGKRVEVDSIADIDDDEGDDISEEDVPRQIRPHILNRRRLATVLDSDQESDISEPEEQVVVPANKKGLFVADSQDSVDEDDDHDHDDNASSNDDRVLGSTLQRPKAVSGEGEQRHEAAPSVRSFFVADSQGSGDDEDDEDGEA